MRRGIRLLLLVIIALSWITCATAQSAEHNEILEKEIRRLDSTEAAGLLHKDIALLETIWASDFTVNNPRNRVTHGRNEVVALIRNGIIDYSSFIREIETILFYENTVIVMGSETIKPIGKAPFAGQTVRRRFTHFWMMRDGEWRLTARHANVICSDGTQ